MDQSYCPVPYEQIPLNEFKNISNSYFFSILSDKDKSPVKMLIISWIIAFPIFLVISYGDTQSKINDATNVIGSLTISLTIPILLLIRQFLSWNYIYTRLISDIIEYEESGWYDGQKWSKPEEWKEKDKLVASHDVKPIIQMIIKLLKFLLISLLIMICIYTYIK